MIILTVNASGYTLVSASETPEQAWNALLEKAKSTAVIVEKLFVQWCEEELTVVEIEKDECAIAGASETPLWDKFLEKNPELFS